ncbi:MAG: FIG01269488: protein, clustered with ribosomal protein L32p, partial [uncultured Solirubrobacteraceae bacterium]
GAAHGHPRPSPAVPLLGSGAPAGPARPHRSVRLRRPGVRGRPRPDRGAPRRLAHDGQRLRAAGDLRGDADRPVRPLPRAGGAGLRGRLAGGPPARRRRRAHLPLRERGRGARPRPLGPRRPRARAARDDHLPPGLRGPVRGVRGEPQRGSGPRPRPRAGPAVVEAVGAQVRL